MRIAKAIEGGKGGHYQLDSLGANLFISIVERYLAEYRTLFQRYSDMRQTLIGMLDLFVDAGAHGATVDLRPPRTLPLAVVRLARTPRLKECFGVGR